MTQYYVITSYANTLGTSIAQNEEQLARKKLEFPSFTYFRKNEVPSMNLNKTAETAHAFMVFVQETQS